MGRVMSSACIPVLFQLLGALCELVAGFCLTGS